MPYTAPGIPRRRLVGIMLGIVLFGGLACVPNSVSSKYRKNRPPFVNAGSDPVAYLVGEIRQETASVSRQLANQEISGDEAATRLNFVIEHLDFVNDRIDHVNGKAIFQGVVAGIVLSAIGLLVALLTSPSLRQWLLSILAPPPRRSRRGRAK